MRAGRAIQSIEWLLLALLILSCFAVRIYHLGAFPDTILADEADNAQAAVAILHHHPPANGFFGFDWTPQPAFSVYKEAAFIAVFGFNVTAMRLPSALISALALVPFYLLLRRQFSIAASWLATFLLATAVWYLNFSRSGWNNIDPCFYMLMAMLFLLRALDSVRSAAGVRDWRAWGNFAGAGFFCALGLYAYPSGRIITVGVLVSLPVAMLLGRARWRMILAGFLVLIAVEAVAFLPQGLYIARNWARFNGRSTVVSILNTPEYKADPARTLVRQVDRNVRGPWQGDVNNTPQYSPVGEPQLDRFTGLLVLAGMMLTAVLPALRHRFETWLWWSMLASGWALTQVLTTHSPNGARGIVYLPALVYFAAVCLDAGFARAIGNSSQRGRATAARAFKALAVLAVVLLGILNVKHYVDWQRNPQTRQARYLYVTTREFGDWSAAIVARARAGQVLNVDEWRSAHPIQDVANPYP